ncbi:ATP-grasp domain-containing protein [Methylomonas sp. MgM2]
MPSKLLVVAQSARMLVQLAFDAGFEAVAIDCFGDEDTQQLALEAIKVASLALCNVRPVAERLRGRHGLVHVVYGSGLERHLETLAYLERHWMLLGNSADVFKQFHDAPAFFARLTSLAIAYPETVFSPPGERGDWLVKPVRGEGGMEISHYDPHKPFDEGEWYWQRRMPGRSMSVLFLAGEGRVKLLGANRQWTANVDDRHPFVFGGIINRAKLSVKNKQVITEWLTKLVECYPLRGLGSLDFMLIDDQCFLLEINPRVPASAQLYGDSILSLHVQACFGVLGECAMSQPKGYQILFAHNPIVIPPRIRWAEWVVDRPPPGSLIGKGKPICSIIAAGKDAGQVEERLRHQRNFIEKLFKTGP